MSSQTSNAIDRALFNFSKPEYPPCLYIGSASDVFGVWLKGDNRLTVDIALPSYPRAPQVYGLNCGQGK